MTASTRKARSLVAVAAALLLLTPIAASATPTQPKPAPSKAAALTGQSAAEDPIGPPDLRSMQYQGGRVIKDPRVYVVYWGSEWGQPDDKGMPTVDPRGVAPLVTDFFGRLGGKGDTWSPILTQYCTGVTIGAKTCGSGSSRIKRLDASPLRGWWVDTSPPLGQVRQDVALGHWHDVTDRALERFGPPHPDTIVVLVRPITSQDGQCAAFHTVGRTRYGKFPIIVLPYPPHPGGPCSDEPPVCDLGKPAECQPKLEYAVTGLASHEYAEVLTNPFPTNCLSSTRVCGWIVKDAPAWASRPEPLHTEISDTCAGFNFTMLGGKKTKVAKLWSNTANNGKGACVTKYISDKVQS